MNRKMLAASACALAVAGVVYFAVPRFPGLRASPGVPGASIEANPRPLSSDEAARQRVLHYSDIGSVAETLELPSPFAQLEALYVIAGRSDAAGVRRLMDEAKRISDPVVRRQSMEVVLLRYVEIDPRAALNHALRGDRSAAAELVPAVLAAWARVAPDDAIEAASALPTQALRTASARAIVAGNRQLEAQSKGTPQERRRLAARLGIRATSDAFASEADVARLLDDPHREIEGALQMPAGHARNVRLMRIAEAWARVAPEEAWEHASSISDADSRWIFEQSLISTWSARQPELALAHVSGLAGNPRRDELLTLAAVELARRDAALAMRLVENERGRNRERLQSLVVEQWARFDPASAARWVEQQPGRSQALYAFHVGNQYVLQDAEEALAWALRISRSPGRNLWSQMVGQLARSNPDEALRIALSAEYATQRNQALYHVLSGIGLRDPELAMRHLDKLPPGGMRWQVTAQVALGIAENSSAAAALDWLENLEDVGFARQQALVPLGHMIASRDPDGAAQLLDRIPGGEARAAWINAVANAYAESDVEKGVQWVRRFHDDPDAPGAVANFASNIAMKSPDTVMELVDRLVQGRDRDQVLMSVLPAIAMQSPETAIRHVTRIEDETMRGQSMQMVVSHWARMDAAAARRWVTAQPSSSARDNAILNLVGADPDFDETLSLLGQMQSHDRRMDAVMMMALRLKVTDPERARTLLRRYPLDPARQQQLDSLGRHRGAMAVTVSD